MFDELEIREDMDLEQEQYMNSDIQSYGVNTYPYTFSMTAIETMKHLFDQGYRAFEFMMFPGHIWPAHASNADRKEIAAFASRNSCEITTLNQPSMDINIGAAVQEMREYSIAALERTIMLAADVGAKCVIVGTGKANPIFPATYDTMRSRCFDAFDRFSRLADRLNVRLVVENMPAAFVPGANELVKLLEDYGDPSIGVVYDVANGAFIDEKFDHAMDIIGARLEYIHLSDTPKTVLRHDPINGSGIVDFPSFARKVHEIGHKGPLILEVISANPDADFRDSIRSLHEYGVA